TKALPRTMACASWSGTRMPKANSDEGTTVPNTSRLTSLFFILIASYRAVVPKTLMAFKQECRPGRGLKRVATAGSLGGQRDQHQAGPVFAGRGNFNLTVVLL